MRARFVAIWVAICIVTLGVSSIGMAQGNSPPPDSAEGRARESFQRGRIHYENGEFDAAALAFEEAYALSGRDALLYNLYLAYRDANQQEKAAEALRNYLTRVEVIENRAQLEARLKALEAGLLEKAQADEARRAEEAQRQNVGVAPVAGPRDAPVDEGAKKWWLVPAIVAGAGGVLMLAAIPTALMVKSKQSELDDKCMDGTCDPSLKSTADSGKTLSYVTDGLLIGGGAVAVTGVVLLLLKKPKPDASEVPTTAFACTTAGCRGSVSMRF